ncbi:MAG: alpha-N-acetylglucosaminidase [Thalassobius sp.]|nr:alpha-N-acetylglucosaminidase [Thalassovita sp.]
MKPTKTLFALRFSANIILLSYFLFSCSKSVEKEIPDEVKPVYQTLERVIGKRATEFEFVLTNNSNEEFVEIEVVNNKPIIRATTPVALSYGAYHYLKNIHALQFSWEGKCITLPESWPDFQKTKLTVPFLYRQYLNVCAFGYTTPWWNWQRWEQEIDWMVLHGINMPTAMEGQEAIYLKLWQEIGLEKDTILNYFAGPAFLPWHRMGNINSYGGPLPINFIEQKSELQKKILQRMRELGMKPVAPAFSGYVPEGIKKEFPDAKITQLKSWNEGMAGTFLLDPTDPLFNKIGKRFIELYNEMYGQADFYLADSFNEMKPPVTPDNKQELLAKYGEAVYKPIATAAPGATWVMQGWLFGHDREFWDNPSVKAFLSKVPNDSIIIQDFGNDRYPDVWKDAEAYVGKQWTYGYVHNYGGSNPVYGDFDFYNEEFKKLVDNPETGSLVGYGVLPEGLNNNSIVYEYLYDLPWTNNGINWNEWIDNYTQARYGKSNDQILEAWDILKDGLFSTRYWSPRWWKGDAGAYLFFKRPTTDVVTFEGHPSDLTNIPKGTKLLLENVESPQKDSLLIYDAIDATRHYVSIKIDSLLTETVKTYQNKDFTKGDSILKDIESIASKLDLVIGYQPFNNVNYWLQSAYDLGKTEEESWFYVQNARTQITVWGGTTLKDYASKSWQGMYKDFYLPRWQMLFTELKESVSKSKELDIAATQAKIKAWEQEWCKQKEIPLHMSSDDPVTDMLELFERLEE